MSRTVTNGDERKEGGSLTTCACRKRKAAAEAEAAFAPCIRAAADADGVRIHGHLSSIRQGSTAANCCAGSQEDVTERENISFERSGCAEGRVAPDIPVDPGTWACIDHLHDRPRRSDQVAVHLEHPARIGVAQAVESDCSRQVTNRSVMNSVDARKEGQSDQIRIHED